jgi:hypothetical protein
MNAIDRRSTEDIGSFWPTLTWFFGHHEQHPGVTGCPLSDQKDL